MTNCNTTFNNGTRRGEILGNHHLPPLPPMNNQAPANLGSIMEGHRASIRPAPSLRRCYKANLSSREAIDIALKIIRGEDDGLHFEENDTSFVPLQRSQ